MSAGPPWLRRLVDEAAGAGLELTSASAHTGMLTLTLRPPGGPPLAVEVKPRQPDRRYFRQTARYGLSYRGAAHLSPAQTAALERLADLLRSLEAGFPAALEAQAGVDHPATGAGFACTVERATSIDGTRQWSELLLRLTSRCNQRCPFCSAPPPHDEPNLEAVLAWLDEVLPRLPRPTVTLTGGEPTLWPGLDGLLRRLLARPDGPAVRVQTNAVTLADPGALAGWPRSERLSVFVSFHAAVATIYDACTGTRGQFDRAVAGIRNLLAAGHEVILNLVATRFNADHLADWVCTVPVLFPTRTPRIHFSITMCPEHRPTAPDCLVRYTELAPRLQAAAAAAAAAGVDCEPLVSSSHASIPPCLVAPEHRVRGGVGRGQGGSLPVQRAAEVGTEDPRKPWIKARRCAACAQTRWCLGLPRSYVLRFGLEELRPIPAQVPT